ncbi:hypothetical protein Scep_009648 [Stephania cephalantha]|uniref:Uncharacterized protein n=1 Tax=Stephania cephalantha TaxID=152367 RepID=A0AAP0JW14_9MAGN
MLACGWHPLGQDWEIRRWETTKRALDDRYMFLDETNKYYCVDMKVLTKPSCEEEKKYYLSKHHFGTISIQIKL